MTVRTRNWITAAGSMLLLVMLGILMAALGGRPFRDLEGRPSTFFTDETGARALLLVMQELLPSAVQWRRPLTELPRVDDEQAPTTLIVASPDERLSELEALRLDAWLADGGQLILATTDGWEMWRDTPAQSDVVGSTPVGRDEAEGDGAAGDVAEGDGAERSAAAGDGAARGAEEGDGEAPTPPPTSPPGSTYLDRYRVRVLETADEEASVHRVEGPALSRAMDLFVSTAMSLTGDYPGAGVGSEKPILLEIPVGRGRVVAIADPGVVSNQALRAADNAVWLVELCAGWRNGRVAFDEFHHGFAEKRSMTALAAAFAGTPWGWTALQLAGAGLLYLFGVRGRLGRLIDRPPPERRSPLDQIEARAGLFQVAAARSLSIELIYQQLIQDVGSVCGGVPDLEALKRHVATRAGSSELLNQVERLQALYDRARRNEPLSEHQLLEAGAIAGRIQRGVIGER